MVCTASMLAAAAPEFAEVRAVFEKNCFKCHGPEKQKGGLRFDISEGAFKAGESGEKAIVPGHGSESRLIKLVSSTKDDERMPPKGDPLSAKEILVLRNWIDAGAKWPANSATTTVAKAEMVVTDEDRKHWAYRPLKTPALPEVKNARSIRTPVDRFVVAALEKRGMGLSREASAAKLARRLYFDLIGLPPTPAQVNAFVQAHAMDARAAVESLADELLASPHYGERWARHWLDVARYADSDGQESDADRPTAHHFRDFVIRSLNDDLRFDTFLQWQLAGDELEPNNPQAVAATGFIVAGTHAELKDNLMEEERIRTRFNELDDMLTTTGQAMLGLTLGCARCHDHKYDPVPRRDYYRMLSAFNGGDRAEAPLVPIEEAKRNAAALAKWKSEFEPAKKELDDWLKKKTKELGVKDKEVRGALNEADRTELAAREEAIKKIEARKPAATPTAFGFADSGSTPRESFLLARGDFHAKSERVELGFLTALTRGKTPAEYWADARAHARRDDSTQQRRAMAEWMTDTDHGAGPLAARVIVNRIWQHHFGQGLVRTVNDFGVRADPATHPELLEWLASEFVKGGWKLKPLHRLIVTSAAYLQDTEFDATRARIDPDNRLLWRRRPMRLEAEILRDAMLSVSGAMNPQMFGPAVKAPIPAEAIQARNMIDPYPKDVKESGKTLRRSIYLFHKRVVQQPLMQAFDGPDAQASCGRRENTTVAPQALALMNDKFVRARALDFADRIANRPIQSAWQIALGREPSKEEIEAAENFVTAQMKSHHDDKRLALADLCQVIFAMNEFIYVD